MFRNALCCAAVAEPVSPVFTERRVARADEIDELGHVSNIEIVRWIQDIAWAHSIAVGWDVDRYRAVGAVFVVRRHEIDYLRPVMAGDEVEVQTWIESWTGAASIRATRVRRLADGVAVAAGATQWVFVSIASGRPRRIPADVATAFLRGNPR